MMANFVIFYLTKGFLCAATEEFHSNPNELHDKKHYQLVFRMFKHKIVCKKDVAFVPIECWNAFTTTKHHSPFERSPILKSAIRKDEENGTTYSTEIEALLERSSFASGRIGGSDVYIAATDDELAEIKAKDTGYPVYIRSVDDCIAKLKEIYPE